MNNHDTKYLQAALAQAVQGLGFCAPNPAVGAIVVKNQQIIASGYHAKAGSAHAEAVALQKLSDADTAGATLYVTLEPCNHQGRTPPCTDLIIQKKIARVVYGFKDPNTAVKGSGAKQLHQAAIACDHVPSDEINSFYEPYAWYCTHRRPFVTGKLAISLDGKIAAQHGARTIITGVAFQQWVHAKRLQTDAILTSAKTIMQDDPYLNVRLENCTVAKPLYILDRQLTTPLHAKIFSTGAACCFFYEHAAAEQIAQFQAQGARCIKITAINNQLNLNEILDVIGQDGVQQLWLEAGGRCFQNFVLAGLMNKAYLAIGLKWLNSLASAAFDQDIFATTKFHQWFIVGDDAVCEIKWDALTEPSL